MKQGLFILVSGLLMAGLTGCDDSSERRARYAEKKPAPRPLERTFDPPKKVLPPAEPKKKAPGWMDYKGEDMRQAGCVNIAGFPYCTEDIAQKQTIEQTGNEALDESENRIDLKENRTHGTGSAYADTLKEAGKAENGTCRSSACRTKRDGTDRYRDDIEGDRQGTDVQISQRRVRHQKQHCSHKTEDCQLRCFCLCFHIQFSPCYYSLMGYNTITGKV